MQKFTPEQLREKFLKLPQDLRDAVFSEEISVTITAIGKKYNFLLDKIGELDDEAMNVVFGITHPKDFISNLETRLKIDRKTAGEIANEINQQVFLKLRESLKKVHKIEDGAKDGVSSGLLKEGKFFGGTPSETQSKPFDKFPPEADKQGKPKIPFSDLKNSIPPYKDSEEKFKLPTPIIPPKPATEDKLKSASFVPTPPIRQQVKLEEKTALSAGLSDILQKSVPPVKNEFEKDKSAESVKIGLKPEIPKPLESLKPIEPAKTEPPASPGISIFEKKLKDEIFRQMPEETKKEMDVPQNDYMTGKYKNTSDPYLLKPEPSEIKPKDRAA
ncbi:MAG: hypothetical protein COU46_02120 [Candidatus Niyogibacteria bacterium CG10_big_fil_rev_8_21_14_0_10_42_19]|uniref:Uncharacterized protein n=1 Tax=Candidatus Niyogibacteria bacterium CG10_big_fil_rev_8_21_14_0_10_42_19 TaxID=1974725 RepID=A0A2H0TFH9_9BACT|nr:MAG: hypothetical protein COU46_02120 [Candidatus Niyogibacteria bacterium CG10_big_fil_rev_8_21_14_0_10_42_19]